MANVNTLNTRIALKYDTLDNWLSSSLVLHAGEVAIAVIDNRKDIIKENNDHNPVNTPPAIAMKIGDGTKTFAQLPWVQAVAGDVYAWAKKASTPKLSELSEINKELAEMVGDIIGDHAEIQDTDTFYKVAQTLTGKEGEYIIKLKAYDKAGQALTGTDKDVEINLSDIDTRLKAITNWQNGEQSRVQGWIETAQKAITVRDEEEGAFVTGVENDEGAFVLHRKNVSSSDFEGQLTQGQVEGLTQIQTDVTAAKGQLANTDYGTKTAIAADNKLMTKTAVQRDIETALQVLDNYEQNFSVDETTGTADGKYVVNVTRNDDGDFEVARADLKVTHEAVTDWQDSVMDALYFSSVGGPKPTATNYIVRKDDIATLAGAMHFRGAVNSNPMEWATPTNNPDTDAEDNYVSGDIVIYTTKETVTIDGTTHEYATTREYVFNGEAWIELGDEGVHASKGSVAELRQDLVDLETKHDNEKKALDQAIANAESEAIKQAQANTETHVNTELGKLTHKQGTEGKFVISVTQEKGQITVNGGKIELSDLDFQIPATKISIGENNNVDTELSRVAGLVDAADGGITTANKLATQSTIETALNTLNAIAKDGNAKHLVQDEGDILFLDCGSSTKNINPISNN